ncbi:hypothetical protein [Acidithiobacillus sp.]
MATQLHESSQYLIDAERLLHALRALVPHAWALAWAARALERDAKVIVVCCATREERIAYRLEALAERALSVAQDLHGTGIVLMLVRRSLLRSAAYFTQVAYAAKGQDPTQVPVLTPMWRSAIDALSDLFKIA